MRYFVSFGDVRMEMLLSCPPAPTDRVIRIVIKAYNITQIRSMPQHAQNGWQS